MVIFCHFLKKLLIISVHFFALFSIFKSPKKTSGLLLTKIFKKWPFFEIFHWEIPLNRVSSVSARFLQKPVFLVIFGHFLTIFCHFLKKIEFFEIFKKYKNTKNAFFHKNTSRNIRCFFKFSKKDEKIRKNRIFSQK